MRAALANAGVVGFGLRLACCSLQPARRSLDYPSNTIFTEARFGNSWAYPYLYPGLQKVVQAAGRVIRTAYDTGVHYLMDDRFAQPEIRALLPPWWDVRKLVD